MERSAKQVRLASSTFQFSSFQLLSLECIVTRYWHIGKPSSMGRGLVLFVLNERLAPLVSHIHRVLPRKLIFIYLRAQCAR